MLSSQVKFSANRQTDRQTDRRTPLKQYAPLDLSMLGHKNCRITQKVKTNTAWKNLLKKQNARQNWETHKSL